MEDFIALSEFKCQVESKSLDLEDCQSLTIWTP